MDRLSNGLPASSSDLYQPNNLHHDLASQTSVLVLQRIIDTYKEPTRTRTQTHIYSASPPLKSHQTVKSAGKQSWLHIILFSFSSKERERKRERGRERERREREWTKRQEIQKSIKQPKLASLPSTTQGFQSCSAGTRLHVDGVHVAAGVCAFLCLFCRGVQARLLKGNIEVEPVPPWAERLLEKLPRRRKRLWAHISGRHTDRQEGKWQGSAGRELREKRECGTWKATSFKGQMSSGHLHKGIDGGSSYAWVRLFLSPLFCQLGNISARFRRGHGCIPDIKKNPSGADSGVEGRSRTSAGHVGVSAAEGSMLEWHRHRRVSSRLRRHGSMRRMAGVPGRARWTAVQLVTERPPHTGCLATDGRGR